MLELRDFKFILRAPFKSEDSRGTLAASTQVKHVHTGAAGISLARLIVEYVKLEIPVSNNAGIQKSAALLVRRMGIEWKRSHNERSNRD